MRAGRHYNSKTSRPYGFTIVELLIVIVVIAILAAISVVAYNGIRERAINSNTATVVNAYIKALAQYAVVNQAYPPVGATSRACLGDNNPGGTCWNGTISEDTTFNSAIQPFLGGKIPEVNAAAIGGLNGAMFVNHTHSSVTLDGQQYPYYLWYLMAGTGAKCPVGQLLSGGWTTFTSTVPATGYTSAVSGGTQCWIKLPRPNQA